MDDREIDALIAELRRMLDEDGFGWAREQAEGALPPATPPRSMALALIAAAESVTVDLARSELAMLDSFGTEEIHFRPDLGADPDGDGPVPPAPSDRLRGAERQAALRILAEQGEAFARLRRQVDERD
jgi:hypothetical protein